MICIILNIFCIVMLFVTVNCICVFMLLVNILIPSLFTCYTVAYIVIVLLNSVHACWFCISVGFTPPDAMVDRKEKMAFKYQPFSLVVLCLNIFVR